MPLKHQPRVILAPEFKAKQTRELPRFVTARAGHFWFNTAVALCLAVAALVGYGVASYF